MKDCKKTKRKTRSSSIKPKKRQQVKYNFASEDSAGGYTSGSDSSDVFASGPDTQNLDTSDEEQDTNFLYDTPNQSPSKGKIPKSSNQKGALKHTVIKKNQKISQKNHISKNSTKKISEITIIKGFKTRRSI